MGLFRLRGQRGSKGSQTPESKSRREAVSVPHKGIGTAPAPFNETFKFQPLAGSSRRPKQAAAVGPTNHPTESERQILPGRTGNGPLSRATGSGNGDHEPTGESPVSFLKPSPRYEAERPAPAVGDLTSDDPPSTYLRPGLLSQAEGPAPAVGDLTSDDPPSTYLRPGLLSQASSKDEAKEAISGPAQPGETEDFLDDNDAIYEEGEPGGWGDESAPARTPKVLVVDREGQLSAAVAKAAVDLEPAPEILRLNRSTQLSEVVSDEQPDVILVAPEDVTGAGLKRLAEVHRADPRVVILLSDNGKPLSLSQITASGASDIIGARPTKARLRSKLAQALRTAEELRKENVVITERVVVKDSPVPASAPEMPAAQHTRFARILTVASASGGSGKTFLSSNLAAYLAKATSGTVLLVDLDLQFGEIAIALRLRPPQTIAELVEEQDLPAALADYVVEHRCGFKVLCAPGDPMSGERIGSQETTAILDAARRQFDYIVVDTPPTLNDNCLAAFDLSDSLVILANMDLASLKNLHVFLETLEQLKLRADQVSLIVNKAESGTGLNLEEVEPIFPQGFTAVLPYAKEVSRAINTGIPVLEGEPKAEISRKLAEGFMNLVPASLGVTLPWGSQPAPPRQRRLARLLKGKAR